MKTKDFVMAMAALAIAGCSQNEVTDVNPDIHPAVGFDVYTGVQTKGAETTTTTLKAANAGFGILGFYTGASNWEAAKANVLPNFMYNEKAYYKTSSWTYDATKYWPSNPNHMITFFAYAPYEATPTVGGNTKGIVLSGKTQKGVPYIDFTLKGADKLDEMVDLVVADKSDETYSKNSGTVNFQFKHILSKVQFKVKLKNALSGGTRIFVKKLEILGSANNGNSQFYTKAKYANQHWGYDATNIPSADFDVANIMNTAAVTVGDYSKTAIEATTSATSLFKNDQFLFLIPVNDKENPAPGEETGTTANGEIKVRLTYDAITPDTNDNTKYLVSETEALVDLPSGALKLGTAYTYTFNLTLNPVVVSVDENITEWANGNGGEI